MLDQWVGRICAASARQRGNEFVVEFWAHCVGTTKFVRFQALMGYDTAIADPAPRTIAIDNAPNRGWSRWIRRAPQPTSLSLNHYVYDYPYDDYHDAGGREHIDFDDDVSLTGTVSSSLYTDDIEHANLRLYQRPRGTRRWRFVERERTEYYSTMSYTWSADRPREFQVRFRGNRDWQPSRSKVKFLPVTMAVEAAASAPSLRWVTHSP